MVKNWLTNDAGSKMTLKQFNQQRFAMNGVGQNCFQQNDAFRMTEIGHECNRDDCTVCVPPLLFLNTVRVCSTVHVMRVPARSCIMNLS